MMSHRLKKSENDLKSQKTIIDELELKVKESFEAQMQVTHLSKKDIAMRDQQIEFLTMQLKESKE
jgi:predicted RNase H-like nuclease (RuvC/YqgF family)